MAHVERARPLGVCDNAMVASGRTRVRDNHANIARIDMCACAYVCIFHTCVSLPCYVIAMSVRGRGQTDGTSLITNLEIKGFNWKVGQWYALCAYALLWPSQCTSMLLDLFVRTRRGMTFT